MNYNLSAIMKKAWEIKKENILNLFAPSLKMAWSIVKKGVEIMNEITIGSEKQILQNLNTEQHQHQLT